MNPYQFLKSKGFLKEIFIYDDNNKPHNVRDLLFEYARIETEELEKLLDKQIDKYLTPERTKELLDFLESNPYINNPLPKPFQELIDDIENNPRTKDESNSKTKK